MVLKMSRIERQNSLTDLLIIFFKNNYYLNLILKAILSDSLAALSVLHTFNHSLCKLLEMVHFPYYSNDIRKNLQLL